MLVCVGVCVGGCVWLGVCVCVRVCVRVCVAIMPDLSTLTIPSCDTRFRTISHDLTMTQRFLTTTSMVLTIASPICECTLASIYACDSSRENNTRSIVRCNVGV